MGAIFENPIPVLVLGLVVGSVLGVGYLNTRNRGFLVGVGGRDRRRRCRHRSRTIG